jgi:threonine/homoserine/homoserine lactone efflux protein
MDLDLPLPLRGLVIGFTIAAAVGPISLLVIRRTMEHGRLYGLVSGMGVASADASYAGIAAFGLTAVTGLLVSGRVVLGLVGGLVIAVLGMRTMLSRPVGVVTETARPGLARAFGSIYGLTMTNPMTILSFAAVFAGIGLAAGSSSGSSSFVDAAVVTLAVWAGSALWWVCLTAAVGWLRGRVTPAWLVWINRISGAALVVFGIGAVVGVLS